VPELPEVEVLVRHLRPLLRGKLVKKVEVRRARVLAPTSPRSFREALTGARFLGVTRRGKYLVFEIRAGGKTRRLVGHLGMTGRMYLVAAGAPLPKHAAVVLSLGREKFIFEDTRYFGRLTLDTTALERLGPEPLTPAFVPEVFGAALKRSAQPIKVKLLDQAVVAGVGNIYASEALFRAKISPGLPARRLSREQVVELWRSIREVLADAIGVGSSVRLSFDGDGAGDGLFYYGGEAGAGAGFEEPFLVYDRAGKPCSICGSLIKRVVQAARSTFFCPGCQAKS
jgi:formamidopyrimidine-DNA glycosylase